MAASVGARGRSDLQTLGGPIQTQNKREKKNDLCTIHLSISLGSRRTFYGSRDAAPFCRPDFVSHIAHPLSSVRCPEASGHPDPDFRDHRFSTASMRAAAPPAGGTPLATDSTTETGRST